MPDEREWADAAACPKCTYELRIVWTKNRQLRSECMKCGWVGEPNDPTPVSIETTRTINVSRFGGYEYTIYDQYGYIICFSRTYYTPEEAESAAKDDLKIRNECPNYGPCTAVLWPKEIVVEGKVLI